LTVKSVKANLTLILSLLASLRYEADLYINRLEALK